MKWEREKRGKRGKRERREIEEGEEGEEGERERRVSGFRAAAGAVRLPTPLACPRPKRSAGPYSEAPVLVFPTVTSRCGFVTATTSVKDSTFCLTWLARRDEYRNL